MTALPLNAKRHLLLTQEVALLVCSLSLGQWELAPPIANRVLAISLCQFVTIIANFR